MKLVMGECRELIKLNMTVITCIKMFEKILEPKTAGKETSSCKVVGETHRNLFKVEIYGSGSHNYHIRPQDFRGRSGESYETRKQ